MDPYTRPATSASFWKARTERPRRRPDPAAPAGMPAPLLPRDGGADLGGNVHAQMPVHLHHVHARQPLLLAPVDAVGRSPQPPTAASKFPYLSSSSAIRSGVVPSLCRPHSRPRPPPSAAPIGVGPRQAQSGREASLGIEPLVVLEDIGRERGKAKVVGEGKSELGMIVAGLPVKQCQHAVVTAWPRRNRTGSRPPALVENRMLPAIRAFQ